MKIVFLLPTVGYSGGIRVVAIYAQWLASAGHDVVLVSQAGKAPSLKQRVKNMLRGRGWEKYRPVPASHLDGLNLEHRVISSGKIPGVADVPCADVLISTWWETAEWAAELPPDRGARVYFIQHNEVFEFVPRERCEATYRLPFHKVVIARWLQELMENVYGDASVDLVPNGVDHALFYAPARRKNIIPTVGMLYHEAPFKGTDVAIKSVAKLKTRYPNLGAIAFCGKPPSGLYFLPEYIDLHVQPPQEALRDLYASCDVWLTTSRSEGFNLMAMEAMACRTPVVSTRTGWPLEGVIDGVNGYLVNVDDAEAAAEALAKVLELKDTQWRTMSNQAFATVADASWEASCIQFEKALLRACERASKGEIVGVPSCGGVA